MPSIDGLSDQEYEDLLRPIADFLLVQNPLEKADVIFVFGSLRLSAVWLHAAQLYKDGYAPIVAVAGGTGKSTADIRKRFQLDHQSEASFYREEFLKLGVPGGAIVVEEESANTLENIVFGMNVLKGKDMKVDKLILVALPFHIRRCLATFQKQFPRVSLICSPPKISFRESIDRPKDEFAERLVGEVDRLRIYADKGDICEQVIPEEVEKAVLKVKECLEASEYGKSP